MVPLENQSSAEALRVAFAPIIAARTAQLVTRTMQHYILHTTHYTLHTNYSFHFLSLITGEWNGMKFLGIGVKAALVGALVRFGASNAANSAKVGVVPCESCIIRL